jgi:2-polyprenyl-3-methyl-5-hydroxy-6-metoxy-1,4-benzoquinol methylase
LEDDKVLARVDTFDDVVSFETIEHLVAPERALRGLVAALAPAYSSARSPCPAPRVELRSVVRPTGS